MLANQNISWKYKPDGQTFANDLEHVYVCENIIQSLTRGKS